jgi:hypothetical protein
VVHHGNELKSREFGRGKNWLNNNDNNNDDNVMMMMKLKKIISKKLVNSKLGLKV